MMLLKIKTMCHLHVFPTLDTLQLESWTTMKRTRTPKVKHPSVAHTTSCAAIESRACAHALTAVINRALALPDHSASDVACS